ncbi:MAG: outer membrane protein [Verrucomicrobiota bacterium]
MSMALISRGCRRLLAGVAAAAALAPAAAQAEDADRWRPYLHFNYGEFDTPWGVHDLWGFGLGVNVNRHLGFELPLGSFEQFPRDGLGREIGEENVLSLLPSVRLRWPFLQDRLVVYAIGGVGPAFLSFNDRKPVAYTSSIEANGTALAYSLGGGVDYFVADNVALNIEARYLWVDPLTIRLDGQDREFDPSNPLVTVGLRVYFDENAPRPLADAVEHPRARYFFGVRYGGAWLTDRRWTANTGLDEGAFGFLGSMGQSGGVSLGALFGHHHGVEIAADLWEPNVTLDGTGTITEYAVRTVVPQWVLRAPVAQGRWAPFVSAGVGIAHAEANDRKPPGGGLALDAAGIYPALRLGAGLEYFVVSSLSLTTSLHWSYSWGHELRIDQGPAASGDLSAWQAQVGFRIYFPPVRSR